jgi:hypothetical protein
MHVRCEREKQKEQTKRYAKGMLRNADLAHPHKANRGNEKDNDKISEAVCLLHNISGVENS